MSAVWQAAAARHRFSDLLDAAAAGEPQLVRRRDGTEVVVMSRACFEQSRPTLKSALLAHRFGTSGDAADRALAAAGVTLGAGFAVGAARAEDYSDDHPRHQRRQRPAAARS